MRTIPRSLLATAAAGLLLVGVTACGDGDAPAAAEGPTVEPVPVDAEDSSAPGVRVVSPADAAELLEADPERGVIDVRTPAEFAEGHLEGAELIDVNDADFEQRIAELDHDQPYVLYCRSGNRSAAARQVMSDLGFGDVADVQGGIVAWAAEGLPVVTS